jgi:hypothetical protein
MAVEDRGGYRFIGTQRDGQTPVAYDPCRPLRYVVNARTAPPGVDALLQEAIQEVSAITGLRFEFEGTTDERPVAGREPFQRERYGNRWAPVLIAWSDPTELPQLSGDIAGIGGSAAITPSQRSSSVYVSGIVALDGFKFRQMLERPGGAAAARGVILHELGHLVGLAHVDDPEQLMNAFGTRSELNVGDIAGLSRLGFGECVARL